MIYVSINFSLVSSQPLNGWAQPIATVLGPGLLGAFFAYLFTKHSNRDKTRLEVTKAFTQRYWKILGKDRKIDANNVLMVLDLMSEQIYHMSKGNIIEALAKEWIYGMLDYLPVFGEWIHRDQDKPLNTEYIEKNIKSEKDILEKHTHEHTGKTQNWKKAFLTMGNINGAGINYRPFVIHNFELVMLYPRVYDAFTLKSSFLTKIENLCPGKVIESATSDFFTIIYPTMDDFRNDVIKKKTEFRQVLIDHIWEQICPPKIYFLGIPIRDSKKPFLE